MPQKRNPDAAELVRAKTGRIIGALNALLVVMKGLPLAYAKDMQEDKEGAMDEARHVLLVAWLAMTGMIADLEPDPARMKKAAGEGYATATDLADWLVRALKIPFREAHHIPAASSPRRRRPARRRTGCRFRRCEKSNRGSSKTYSSVLSVDRSVKSRTSFGGTAPKNVRAQAKNGCASWKKRNPDFALFCCFAIVPP